MFMKKDTRFTKSYYKIREVADIIGVPQSTLRFWEQEFPELQPKRSLHNQRTYTPKDLELLEIINFLVKVKGHKLESAKEQLRHNRKNISKRLKIVEELSEVKQELEILRDMLSLRSQKLSFESPQS